MPYESVYGTFDPTLPKLDISILVNNAEPVDDVKSIIFNTRTNKMSDISPCAAIHNFQNFCLYSTQSNLKNCILKYKGSFVLEPKTGSTTKLKKMFTFNKQSSDSLSLLDFSTNVESVDNFFNSRSVKGF